jgi:hypothetical protein
MSGQFQRLAHTCNRQRTREGRACKACDQILQFPYKLTQKSPDRRVKYWNGVQWETREQSQWLPASRVKTGDSLLSATLLVLVRHFGDGLSVQMRPGGYKSGALFGSRSSP